MKANGGMEAPIYLNTIPTFVARMNPKFQSDSVALMLPITFISLTLWKMWFRISVDMVLEALQENVWMHFRTYENPRQPWLARAATGSRMRLLFLASFLAGADPLRYPTKTPKKNRTGQPRIRGCLRSGQQLDLFFPESSSLSLTDPSVAPAAVAPTLPCRNSLARGRPSTNLVRQGRGETNLQKKFLKL